jgi:predicted nucleotidyltransferase
VEKILSQLVERLTKTFDSSLVSVVLYGSGAAGDRDRRSDYNILCVLRQVTMRELALAEPIARWWRDAGNPSPLLLSEDELRTSTDAFPMEFRDIRAEHRILHGTDVVAGMFIDESFYRAQVEHELRAKLLRLRQKAAGMLSDKDLLRGLLADSLSTFCVLFRHGLILSGVEAKMKKREILEQARQIFGIDPAAFEKLLDLREERIPARQVDPGPLLDAYLKEINKVIGAVNAIAK